MASRHGSLLGRANEWKTIAEAIDLVHRGSSRTVFIEGEAGIGKTRLVEELVTNASDAGLSVLSGRADELERALPFGAIGDALRRFRQEMPSTGEALQGLLRSDSTAGEATIVDAFVDFVEELSLSRPLCIVLEDLHWAHTATIKAVRAVARRLSYLPVLTAGTYRPHPRSTELTRLLDAASREGAVELRVGPLDESSLVALIESTLSASVGPRLRRIIMSSAGNPLYATEIARAVSQEGEMRIEDGVADVETVELPPTLRLTILRRISYLPVETMELLRLAAVLGSAFRIEDLVAVKASPVADVVDSLRPAIEAKIVEERADALAFRHDLIQEAIYQDLPSPIRASMHVDTARALRALGCPPVRLAEHIIRGLELGVPELFDEAFNLATELRVSARTVALALDEKVLELPGIPEHRRRKVRIDMLFPLMTSGRMDDAERIANEIMATPQDPAGESLMLAVVLEGRMRTGRIQESLPTLEAIARDPRIPDQDSDLLEAVFTVARVRSGTSSEGKAVASQLIDRGRAQRDDHSLYAGLIALVVMNLHEGRVADAVRMVHELSEIDRRTRTLFSSLLGPAVAWLEADKISDAREACRQGRRLDPAIGDLSWLATYSSLESYICLLEGSWDDAITEAETALDLVAEGLGSADLVLAAHVSLAQILLRRGDIEGALLRLDEVERFVAERGPQWLMALYAWTRAAYVHAARSPHEALDVFLSGWDATVSSRYFLTRPAFPDLVRLSLEVGERRRAEEVAEEAEEGLRRAGDVPSVEGAALHCRGLVDDDPELLLAAVEAYRRSPRLVERARACENAALTLVRRGLSADARALFDEALAFYDAIDATLDVRRLTAAMREAGLRRGPRRKHRKPKVGWDALTTTELQVARLTVEGMTNPQIAERLFISKSTVQTHLAHIFGKLAVSSRVSLAAIAAEKLSPPGRS